MSASKNILVAPLNWGIGHACRCVPIINELLDLGHEVILGSDGESLTYLKKEFPLLKSIKLPSYSIEYPAEGKHFKLKLIKDSPKIWSALRKEHQILKVIVKKHKLDLVISDNRLGLFSTHVKTIFITHQLHVLSGNTTWLSTHLHNYFIKKFDQCWVPDFDDSLLSGRLSALKDSSINYKFIGPLSRFEKTSHPHKKYDLLILLSGPEPQRSILEKRLLLNLKNYKQKVLFIAGKMEQTQIVRKTGALTYYNFLTQNGLQKAFDRSDVVICRSGYSTIMDLYKLEKKAFFIPTPGQFEQEYLANHFHELRIAPFIEQHKFNLSHLEKLKDYTGFGSQFCCSISSSTSMSLILEELFSSVNENSEPIPTSLST
ncbi:MAG: glycosyltransferase [Nonlabens sp.]